MLARRTVLVYRTPAFSLAGIRRLAHRLACLSLLAQVVVVGAGYPSEYRLRQATAPHALDVAGWEIAHLAERGERLWHALAGPGRALLEDDGARVSEYFAAPASERPRLRFQIEEVLEHGLTAVLSQEQLAPVLSLQAPGSVFPPVSLALSEPPKLLVVSPRERIAVQRSVLLEPSVSEQRAERMEATIDDGGLVSLVVPTGGLSTYPSMVHQSAAGNALLEIAAHEWVHAYLFFTPLGQAYWSDPGARIINETVAGIAGRELARKLAARLRLELSPVGRAGKEPRAGFDFSTELRATRQEVDRLLAAGRIAEAEAYMERRRLEFVANGHHIRKLNQAYFAFFGSYGESGAAGANPVASQLQHLREQSPSLGGFLARVGQMRNQAELRRLVEDQRR